MSILVGRQAPDFTEAAVDKNGKIIEKFTLSEELSGKYGILFFYPLDFTFVCPSELIALNKRIPQFQALNTEIIGVSIDSHWTHNAWRNTPVEKGGIGAVDYTLVADVAHKVAQAYGIEHPEAAVAFRAAFLIDKDGVVKAQLVNDLPLGRNVDELVRLVEALQHHEEHGEVCPAGWQKGQQGMNATPEGVAAYLAENSASL